MKRAVLLLTMAGLCTASAVDIGAGWSVVYPDRAVGADAGTEYALRSLAKDLALDLEEAIGSKVPAVAQSKADKGTRGLWLGAPAAKAAGYSFGDWRFLENAYAATNGSVYCFGNDRQAVRDMSAWESHRVLLPSARAAMRFMRDVVGARYVMPGRPGTVVPKAAKPSLADGAMRFERPMVRYGNSRGNLPFSFANSEFPPGVVYDYGGHSFPTAVPTALYGEHPEYFGMNKAGKRPPPGACSPYCLSNPDVQEMIYQEAKKRFESGADICQVGHTDGDSRCYCDACDALYGRGMDWGEKLWIFYRKLAERAERECPGKTVLFLAYHANAQPPKSFSEFPQNTMVQICSYDEDTFRRWSAVKVPKGFTVYLYLWGNYQNLGLTPKRSFAGLAELVSRFRRYNVTGVYRCGGGELPGLEGPQYYYFDRLLENPAAGVSDTLKEFCDAAFGAEAGEPMFRFYETLDSRLRVNDRIGTGHWEADSPDVSKWSKADESRRLDLIAYVYTPDVVATMDGCLAHAKRCRLTAAERTRLKRVEVEWSYARNLGRIATLYNGYRAAPSFERIEPLLKEIKWRNAFLDRIYAPQAKGAKNPDWLWLPLFKGNPREYLQTNSRMAPIYEPLNWDVAEMQKSRLAPGAPEEVARWKRHNAEKGLKTLKTWRRLRPEKPGDVLEIRPDGSGFSASPGPENDDLYIGTSFGPKDGLKPNTRYRVSWFARVEDVTVKPRWREFGFFCTVVYEKGRSGYKSAPSGGGLVGTTDWQHMSMTVKTGDDPKFSMGIGFRLLTGRGRVEVEDVTVEETNDL